MFHFKLILTHLNPATALTIDPSLCDHVIIGIGLPCAVQVTCVPVSFPNKILVINHQ